MLGMEPRASYIQVYSQRWFLNHKKMLRVNHRSVHTFEWDSSQHRDKLESDSKLKLQMPKTFKAALETFTAF